MAFQIRSMIRRANVPYRVAGKTHYFRAYEYATADALSVVIAAGYFNEFRATAQVGDRVFVNAGLGGTEETEIVRFAAVPAEGGGDVTVETAIAYA